MHRPQSEQLLEVLQNADVRISYKVWFTLNEIGKNCYLVWNHCDLWPHTVWRGPSEHASNNSMWQLVVMVVRFCEEKHQFKNHRRHVIVVQQLWRRIRKERQDNHTHIQTVRNPLLLGLSKRHIKCSVSGVCRKWKHRQFHYLIDLIGTSHSSLRRNSHTKSTMMYVWMYVHCM